MHKAIRKVLCSVQPTPRCGALDDDKKATVIVLVGQGASRREAAALVKCHHTTIGRTAARDAAFAAKLAQVEAAAHLAAGDMIRRAASDPKYWRAAAWMLERCNPEDYARRDPTTFTGDQVMSLLASFFHDAQSLVPQEKTTEFTRLFEDVLVEIEAKVGSAKRKENSGEADMESASLAEQKPSSNGHHPTIGAPAAASVSSNGKAHAEHGEGNGALKAVNHPQPNPLQEGEETFASHPDRLPKGEGTIGPDPDSLPKGEERLDPHSEPLLEGEELELDLERRREELYAEIAAHLGGYATAPPSRNARDVLREYHRRYTHQPHEQVASGLSRDALRKVFAVNELQHRSTSCTTAPNTEGRCMNGAPSSNGDMILHAT